MYLALVLKLAPFSCNFVNGGSPKVNLDQASCPIYQYLLHQKQTLFLLFTLEVLEVYSNPFEMGGSELLLEVLVFLLILPDTMVGGDRVIPEDLLGLWLITLLPEQEQELI